MTKFFATTALVAALAVPAFAVQPQPGETLAENQSYTFWMLDAVKTLDPGKITDTGSSEVARSLFEALVNEDSKGAMVPGVAESWDESDDGLTWTFHLRDAKWSNGEPVTAGDFVYAWQRVVDPNFASEYAWYFDLMNVLNAKAITDGEKTPDELGVEAVDDKTLRVTLSEPTPYFLKTLSTSNAFPVLKSVVDAHGDAWTQPGNLVGNGAYTLVSHNLGVEVVMKKNPEYWDAENVIMENVRALTINDENVALTRFQAGELDRVGIPAGQYPRLKEQFPDQATSVPQGCSYGYVFNLSDKGPEALKDVRVRQALQLGMNRDVVVDQVLQGGQKPGYTWTHWAVEGFQQPDHGIWEMTQAERTAKAIELMAEAGYSTSNPLKLQLQYNTSEAHRLIAIAAQQFWRGIGVDVTLNNVEWSVHLDRLNNRDYEMARYAWCADYDEASTFLDWFTEGGYNSGEWKNDEYNAIMAESKSADDTGPLYKRAEELLAAEVPMVTVYHYSKVDMINPAIKGLPMENLRNTWYAKDLYRVAD
ncbi:peptide ABC transporter substrate-binding protein [Paracoccus sp. (in: a-proteobacteria)]|uniref:peptide ABC transporter substrate-binding protein n=1 Tax=Paracoccus sp. TaxID=267 RepID=UPI0026E087B0|nr:peptide ABC transporter substrate-binding protein [Paracoccus sp. (in: a-proteobacteria)]MDO5646363.1 peptide ABC transporter substrate-binding protein [Paracoccus sp. (in: a-proteobacteria)]